MFTPIRETLIQWQDREFPRPVAGMAVVDRQGRLALVYSSYGGQGWHFPKGGIDENESPAEAALKELAEEAGLVARTSGQTSFSVPGGNFIQSLGFGSPRIQPKNLITHRVIISGNLSKLHQARQLPAR
jgi:8-oxo-dGTP pyrophosphatase MutT (NUDIX family)